MYIYIYTHIHIYANKLAEMQPSTRSCVHIRIHPSIYELMSVLTKISLRIRIYGCIYTFVREWMQTCTHVQTYTKIRVNARRSGWMRGDKKPCMHLYEYALINA